MIRGCGGRGIEMVGVVLVMVRGAVVMVGGSGNVHGRGKVLSRRLREVYH